jgi:glycerol dehydrogenase-like iron-containing ADH family enzyme
MYKQDSSRNLGNMLHGRRLHLHLLHYFLKNQQQSAESSKVIPIDVAVKNMRAVEFLEFHGECTWEEFARINQKIDTLQNIKNYCLIGVGGGTNIDCVRAIAYLRNVPFVSVPTLASNDAPVCKCKY